MLSVNLVGSPITCQILCQLVMYYHRRFKYKGKIKSFKMYNHNFEIFYLNQTINTSIFHNSSHKLHYNYTTTPKQTISHVRKYTDSHI